MRRSWFLGAAVVAVAIAWVAGHHDADPGAARRSHPAASRSPQSRPSATPSSRTTGGPALTPGAYNDPARFARQVIRSAHRAGISPRLLMAILYNESYKPHDPAVERAWQKINPGAAFGIANMHKATFDATKRGRPFAGRDWRDLPGHPDLAITAAAWYLHDLARDLPAHRPARYTRNDLLALGYNTGPGNMQAFARGAKPGPLASSYLDRLHHNAAAAENALQAAR